jgi:hypothetical protein
MFANDEQLAPRWVLAYEGAGAEAFRLDGDEGAAGGVGYVLR